jgi:hypothetical protein
MSSSSSSSGLSFLDSKLPMRDLTGKYARFRNEFFLSNSHSIRSSPQPHSSLSGPLLPLGGSGPGDLDEHGIGITLRPEWADIHDQVEADMRSIKESSQWQHGALRAAVGFSIHAAAWSDTAGRCLAIGMLTQFFAFLLMFALAVQSLPFALCTKHGVV